MAKVGPVLAPFLSVGERSKVMHFFPWYCILMWYNFSRVSNCELEEVAILREKSQTICTTSPLDMNCSCQLMLLICWSSFIPQGSNMYDWSYFHKHLSFLLWNIIVVWRTRYRYFITSFYLWEQKTVQKKGRKIGHDIDWSS